MVSRTPSRLDERWAKYVNGSDQNGNARYVPFDGVVPNERSVYPSTNGLSFQGVARLTNHINIYKTRVGLNQAVNGMLGVEMASVGNPPPPPPPTFTASVSGPDAVNNDWYSTWTADVSGGTPPYSYSWSGLFYGSSSSVSGSTSASGDLILDVYDAAGGHATATKFVTATGCTGPDLC